MIRATGAHGLGGVDRVFNPAARQMRGKTTTTVRSGLAFLLVLLVGRPVRWFFRFFLLGFRRGISRAFLPGQLSPRLRGRASSSLGSIFSNENQEAPFVNGHRVLQVASNAFQLLNLSLKGLLFGLPGLGLGLQRFVRFSQPPVFLRQPFLGGRAHGHNLWQAWRLRG